MQNNADSNSLASIDTTIKQLKTELTKTSHGSNAPQKHRCYKCKDVGFETWTDEHGYFWARPCECQKARDAENRLEQSGLSSALRLYTFNTFEAKTALQINMKIAAQKYVEALLTSKHGDKIPWFFIGGNPGSGKTHICTAICGELLKKNIAVVYMPWIEESRKLKAYINEPEFDKMLERFINARVLYIDDFLKERYQESPTFSESDIRIAFAILNARYMMNKPTIISTEWGLEEQLVYVDQSTFSRVYERCKAFITNIPRDAKNNYRFTEGETT